MGTPSTREIILLVILFLFLIKEIIEKDFKDKW